MHTLYVVRRWVLCSLSLVNLILLLLLRILARECLIEKWPFKFRLTFLASAMTLSLREEHVESSKWMICVVALKLMAFLNEDSFWCGPKVAKTLLNCLRYPQMNGKQIDSGHGELMRQMNTKTKKSFRSNKVISQGKHSYVALSTVQIVSWITRSFQRNKNINVILEQMWVFYTELYKSWYSYFWQPHISCCRRRPRQQFTQSHKISIARVFPIQLPVFSGIRLFRRSWDKQISVCCTNRNKQFCQRTFSVVLCVSPAQPDGRLVWSETVFISRTAPSGTSGGFSNGQFHKFKWLTSRRHH